jgi:ABC-type multidrug transport system ATPase subunit
MLTRLAFSIATSVEPEILLLDEGLATGDAQFAHKASRRMEELVARSSILVIASHSEALIANMCNRCLMLEHGRIVADGTATNLVETYRAAVIEAARTDDLDGMRQAYVLATDMAKRGETPPLDLEEQGLRYALRLQPDDSNMWQRYVKVLNAQGKPVAPEVEMRLLLAALKAEPGREDLEARLALVIETSGDTLPSELIVAASARNRAGAA